MRGVGLSERGGRMIEYIGDDAKELTDAISTLIIKCCDNKETGLTADVQYGEIMLHVKFEFSILGKKGNEND